MIDVITLGETIVDLTSAGRSAAGHRMYEENAGGSASIVAATVVKMGGSSALVGKVGADSFGDFLEETMRDTGVSTSGIVFDPEAFTTLCFVDLDDAGRPDYMFVRKPGADTRLEIGELPLEMIESARALHISGLALTDEPIRSAAAVAMQVAYENKLLISLDPNYREDLWASKEEFRARTMNLLNRVDLVIMDLEEMTILTGYENPWEACERIAEKGPKIIIVRMAEDGTFIFTPEDSQIVSTFDIEPIDRTGAGAIFIGTFIANVLKSPKMLDTPLVGLKDIVQLANAASDLSTQVRGGTTSIPSPDEVHKLVFGF
ncbi:MAG: carbohydrate kinase family protein [Fastidiosipilaceae bacterium]|jgi:fructokinase|nr:carbohydrate kinase [Clostridiaceae bacterium]